MDERFDCIVIGAGPAGSMAAKTLAENGASVLLLEKHFRIGVPLACAEAISFSGLASFVQPDPEWISTNIHRVLLVSPSGKRLAIHHPDAGFVLNRKIFDQKMAQMVSSLGACVKTNSTAIGLLNGNDDGVYGVRVLEGGKEKEYYARVIIGADGVESLVARWAGIDSSLPLADIESCAQHLLGEVEVEPDRLEFYLGKSVAPGGYAWVFPKSNTTANVGLAVTPNQTSEKPQMLLDRFVKKRFSGFRIVESTMGGVPCYHRSMSLVRKNVLLVGDAARLVDSLSGAGISNALLSGKIAGEVTGQFIRNGGSSFRPLLRYQDELLKQKGRELKFYSYCRAIYLKMTDEDFDGVVSFLGEYFGDATVTGIQPIHLVKAILKSNPGLLRLLKHLVW
ncbi:MAG: NAD(P)/FAD-dependent oxidoreductase [Candidatus Zixiibacteriota bacterium]